MNTISSCSQGNNSSINTIYKNFLESVIPIELISHIFSFLERSDLRTTVSVSQNFQQLSLSQAKQETYVTAQLFLRNIIGEFKEDGNRARLVEICKKGVEEIDSYDARSIQVIEANGLTIQGSLLKIFHKLNEEEQNKLDKETYPSVFLLSALVNFMEVNKDRNISKTEQSESFFNNLISRLIQLNCTEYLLKFCIFNIENQKHKKILIFMKVMQTLPEKYFINNKLNQKIKFFIKEYNEINTDSRGEYLNYICRLLFYSKDYAKSATLANSINSVEKRKDFYSSLEKIEEEGFKHKLSCFKIFQTFDPKRSDFVHFKKQLFSINFHSPLRKGVFFSILVGLFARFEKIEEAFEAIEKIPNSGDYLYLDFKSFYNPYNQNNDIKYAFEALIPHLKKSEDIEKAFSRIEKIADQDLRCYVLYRLITSLNESGSKNLRRYIEIALNLALQMKDWGWKIKIHQELSNILQILNFSV